MHFSESGRVALAVAYSAVL